MFDLSSDANNLVIRGENSIVLPELPDEMFAMIYIDPPFNTGRSQRRESMKTVRSASG